MDYGCTSFHFLAQVSVSRNAVKDKNLRWPNGVVPYALDPSYSKKIFLMRLICYSDQNLSFWIN